MTIRAYLIGMAIGNYFTFLRLAHIGHDTFFHRLKCILYALAVTGSNEKDLVQIYTQGMSLSPEKRDTFEVELMCKLIKTLSEKAEEFKASMNQLLPTSVSLEGEQISEDDF